MNSRLIADALLSEEAFAARGANRVRMIDEVRGHVTSLCSVQVTFANRESELYWVKFYAGKPDDARAEWAFLQQRTAHGGCELVEGVAYLRSLDAVVTRHAGGEHLSDRMVAENVRRAGAWLGFFHRTEHSDIHDPRALIDDVAARLNRVSPAFGLTAAFTRSTMNAIRERTATIPAGDLRRVRTHGDYAPFNILVGDDAMTVIDPSFEPSVARFSNYCTRHEDYARFFTCIADGQTFTQEQRQSIASQFRRGYIETSGIDPEASGAFALLRMKYGLQALLDRWGGFMAQARSVGIEHLIAQWC